MKIKFLSSLAAAVFPSRCVYCGKRTGSEKEVCTECESSLPVISGKICPSCGRGKKECDCRKKENYYNGICAPFYYEGAVRNGIQAFKFRGRTRAAGVFAAEMAKTVRERFPGVRFDFITAVPMTKRAVHKRGFNQCSLLAEKLSEITGMEYKPGVLEKIYETDTQHRLSAVRRRGNLAGVFDTGDAQAIKGSVILLVDDISTSGETFSECSKMLWLYDAKEVYCVAAALTKAKKKSPEKSQTAKG